MKNISGVLNVVLLIAVAILYYLQFSGKTTEENQESDDMQTNLVENSTIVYINSDSLLANYNYITDKKESLKTKSEKLNAEFNNRAQGLKTEIDNYQRNSNNLTIGQARAVEEDLMKKQQNLKLYEQSLAQQLIEEENKINQELYTQVSSFLKKYGDDNKLHLVVKYNQGSDILYANSGMDITSQVIQGLNEVYENDTEQVQSDTTEAM